MDVGCYCVSGIRLVAGEPEHVRGEQVTGSTGIDMAFHGTLRCAGDVVGQFEASFRSPRRQRLEVVGTEGVLEVEAPWRIDWGGDVTLSRRRRRGRDRGRDDPIETARLLPPRARQPRRRRRRASAAAARPRGRARPGADDRGALSLPRRNGAWPSSASRRVKPRNAALRTLLRTGNRPGRVIETHAPRRRRRGVPHRGGPVARRDRRRHSTAPSARASRSRWRRSPPRPARSSSSSTTSRTSTTSTYRARRQREDLRRARSAQKTFTVTLQEGHVPVRV